MNPSSIWAPVGDKGPTGDPGPQGPPGIQGPPGPDTIGFAIDLANTSDSLKGANLVGGAIRNVTNVAELKQQLKTGLKIVSTLGYYAAGDLGRATYWLDLADTTTADNGVTVHVAVDGGRWKIQHNGVVTSFQAGLKRDGTTNDFTSVINACVSAKVILWMGDGTWMAGATGLPTNAMIGGNGPALSVIKAMNGLNADFFTTTNGPNQNDITIKCVRFDGNSANNSSGSTLTIKGASPTLEHVSVTNNTENGIVTAFDVVDAERITGFQGSFKKIFISDSGKSGWINNGPTDSVIDDVIIIDSSLSANDTYFGLWVGPATKISNVHAWNRAATTNVPSAQVYLNSPASVLSDSHIEGGITPLKIAGSLNTVTTTQLYAPRGQYCMEISGTANSVNVGLGAGSHHLNPAFKGILLTGQDNLIDAVDGNCVNGTIQFSGGEANNFIRIAGYHASGTTILGTPHITDDILINIQGPGGAQFRQEYPFPFKTTFTSIIPSTNTYNNATASMRYNRKGKQVLVQAVGIITDVGTGTGAIRLAIPFTAGAFGYTGIARDTGNGVAYLAYIAPGSTEITITTLTGTVASYSGMTFQVSITFETN